MRMRGRSRPLPASSPHRGRPSRSAHALVDGGVLGSLARRLRRRWTVQRCRWHRPGFLDGPDEAGAAVALSASPGAGKPGFAWSRARNASASSSAARCRARRAPSRCRARACWRSTTVSRSPTVTRNPGAPWSPMDGSPKSSATSGPNSGPRRGSRSSVWRASHGRRPSAPWEAAPFSCPRKGRQANFAARLRPWCRGFTRVS